MSEDADDPDADEHLPEPRGSDGDSGDDSLPATDESAGESTDADLPDRDTGAGESEDTDLPDAETDTVAPEDTDTLSTPGDRETDRLPDVEGEGDDAIPESGGPGSTDADRPASDDAEAAGDDLSATPTDDSADSDEADETGEPAAADKRDTDASATAASSGSTAAARGTAPDEPSRTEDGEGTGRSTSEEPSADEEADRATDTGTAGKTDTSDDAASSSPFGGLMGLSGAEAGDRRAEDFEEGDLPPGDLDRAFSILEEAFTSDAFGGEQLDQLLSVFEGTMTGDGDTDPEAVMELIAMLEQLIIEPDDLAAVDIGGFLSIFEEAISGSTAVSEEDLADVFDVLEEGLRDPTGIDPDDVERFRTGVESAILDMTDPSSGGFGGLFALPGMVAEETAEAGEPDEEAADMFRIARIAAGMTQRATGYSMETGVRTGTRMAYAAANSQSPAELLTNARAIALDELQRAGIDIGEDQQDWLETHEDDLVHPRPVTRETLQERGEALLSQSAEIGLDESIHPSYPMIMDELAPDEARILRLLATEGPQGAVDVYERTYIPPTLTLVARNLTMLGADAGCRDKLETPIYVENLQRLGLVAIRDTPIDDLKRYQVIQAQPHVEAARDSVKRARTKYKRIELTDFGREFCRICFPFDVVDVSAYDTFRSETGE